MLTIDQNYSPNYQAYTPNFNIGGYSPPNYGYQPPQTPLNIMQQAQQRLASLDPAYGQQMQQAPPQNPQGSVAAILVTSIEEARASTPDLNGGKRIFYNTSTGEIYTKQFNVATGAADFDIYERKAAPGAETQPATEGADSPLEEPQARSSIEELEQDFRCTMSGLVAEIQDLKETIKDAAWIQSSSPIKFDGPAEPASQPDDAAGAADEPDGAKPVSNPRKPNTAKPTKSNAAKPAGQK